MRSDVAENVLAEPMGSASPVLEVFDVTKTFPGVRALSGASFSVRPGEVHALVGENGAGKSTLIKIMTGVYSVDTGEVRLAGQTVHFDSPQAAQRAGVSTIYQEVNLIPLMSVARNLFLGREPKKFGLIDSARMRREAAKILADFGIKVNVSVPLRSLGLGAQQMVAIARAVQIDAKVVIMDEPTSSLEQREVETLFEVIAKLKAQGIAVVYVSHRLDELFRICDRATVLRDGHVVHVGDVADLTRLKLISLMLGRDFEEVKHQAAAGSGSHDVRSGEAVVTASNLTRARQLHDVSVEIRPGEVVGLGGLLGSGRSETARAMIGDLRVDSGRVKVGGSVIKRNSPAAAIRAGIVMLPEDRKLDGIIPNLSVRENIVLAALPRLSRAGLVDTKAQDKVVHYFFDRLKIKASSPEQKVSDLSGGNQQKVMLARWLCLNPKAILLDEPTRGIDVGAKAEVQTVIDELAAEGLGVMLISSELDELIDGADRIVVLKDGRVVDSLEGADVSETALLNALATAPPSESAVEELIEPDIADSRIAGKTNAEDDPDE